MKTLYIDKNTHDIPDYALIDSDLKCILVEAGHTSFTSLNGILYSADLKKLIKVPAELSAVYKMFPIPDGVEEIADNAFLHCKFNNIQFPKSLKVIHSKSLNGYIGEVDLSAAAGLSRIDSEALMSFEKVILPVGAQIIVESNGLSYITNKTKIIIGQHEVYSDDGTLLHVFDTAAEYTFPGPIKRVADKAFVSVLHNIKKITINKDLQTFWNPYIENFSNLQDVDVPKDHPMFFKCEQCIYCRTDGQMKLVLALQPKDNVLSILGGTTIIDIGACCRITLDQIIFPESLHTISAYAFHRLICDTVDLRGTALKKISHHAFELATISDKIVFPNTLEKIGYRMFAYSTCGCVDFSQTAVTVMPSYCFSYSSIDEILFPAILRTIETQCFNNTTFKNTEMHLEQFEKLKIDYSAFCECNLKLAFINKHATILPHSFDENIRVIRY